MALADVVFKLKNCPFSSVHVPPEPTLPTKPLGDLFCTYSLYKSSQNILFPSNFTEKKTSFIRGFARLRLGRAQCSAANVQ